MGDRPVVADGPLDLSVQTATSCNLACTVCPHRDVYRSCWFMADSTWDMIIKSINDLPSLVYVTITQNNEPLMDPSIYNKIRDVNRKTGKKSIIITNGKALVDAKTRASLVDAAPSRVDISLISGNKEEYETITGLSFSRTINTIKMCAHTGLNIQVLVAKTNNTDVRYVLGMLSGIPVQFNPLTSNAGLTPQCNELYTPPFKHQHGTNCPHPLYFMVVRYNGDVVLCCFDWESNTILGNVNFTPLREIYYGKVLSEFRKEMSQGIYSLSMCKTCAKEFGYGI